MKSRFPNFFEKKWDSAFGFSWPWCTYCLVLEVSGVKGVWCKSCWCTNFHALSGVQRFLCKSCLVYLASHVSGVKVVWRKGFLV